MKLLCTKTMPLILFLIVWVPGSLWAQTPISVKTDEGRTEIAFLQGGAFLVKPDLTKIRPLVQGGFLNPGDRILTEKRSRIELKLPDQSVIRFDEQTTFVLESSGVDSRQQSRNISLNMILGKIWANVSRLFGNRGRFTVSTRTAVAGVRGTVYRMNVNEDNSVVVKVYQGEVGVSGRQEAPQEKPAAPVLGQPSPVKGPQPIAGPRPVTMQEWTFIVRSMQQINISADGRPSEPFQFNREEDLNDWVRFNEMRDQMQQIQQR